MTLLIPDNEDRLEEATKFVEVHPMPTIVELQQHFAIGWDRAVNLANVLQERGLWPKCAAKQGARRTCLLFKGHTRGHIFEI